MANEYQDDMIAVAKGVHEQVAGQLREDFACMVVIVHRSGDTAAAHNVPLAMVPDVLNRVRKLQQDGNAQKLIYLPPGVARA